MTPKRVLVFDTETTGLPKDRVNALLRAGNWPDIVSIAWTIHDGGSRVDSKYSIIIPESWKIPAESIKFHGITQEVATVTGSPLSKILQKFAADLKTVDTVVAHNLEFDRNVLFNAYKWRLGIDPLSLWPKNEFCTMNASEHELRIPLQRPHYNKKYKSPGLDELYRATFGVPPIANAHNSLRDVEVLSQIITKRWPHLSGSV